MPLPTDTWTFKRFFARMEQWDLSLTSTFAILTIVLIVAAARRFYNLDTYSLWSDELWGVVACSQGSWWGMIDNLVWQDSHPPGYQTLLYWWMAIFGNSDFSIRAPSAIAGVITIITTFELGRRHFSVTTGLIAATMVSGAYQAVYYSQEARAYVFLMAIAPLYASYYLDLFVARYPERLAVSTRGFWVTATVILYLHYVGSVIFACTIAIWFYDWLRSGCSRERARFALRVFGIPTLMYLPWMPVMYHHLVNAPESWATPAATFQRITDTYRFLLGPENLRFYLSIACLAILPSLRGSSFFKKMQAETPSIENHKLQSWDVLLLLSILPVLVFVAQSHISTSAYTIRHFTYTIPFFAIMIACVPAMLARLIPALKWRTRYVIFFCLVSASLNTYYNAEAGLYEHYMKEDFRGAVDIIIHDKRFMNADEDKVIVTNSPFFDHYISRSGISNSVNYHLYTTEQLPTLKLLLQQKKVSRFYYLEVGANPTSPVLDMLSSEFTSRCFSRLNRIRVAKFIPELSAIEQEELTELNDCPLKRAVRPQGSAAN